MKQQDSRKHKEQQLRGLFHECNMSFRVTVCPNTTCACIEKLSIHNEWKSQRKSKTHPRGTKSSLHVIKAAR